MVVGAGFIGSEVAATCRMRGLHVTVLEALPAPLVRGLGPVLGMVCGELHRDHGVDLRLGVGVAAIEGDGRVERVRLDDGSTVEAVVVGVGVVPVTDWLEGSGLVLDNGIVCDETLLAAPGIVAAGDVARWPNPLFDGELMRLEHWTNAAEQGVAAARRLLVTEGDEMTDPDDVGRLHEQVAALEDRVYRLEHPNQVRVEPEPSESRKPRERRKGALVAPRLLYSGPCARLSTPSRRCSRSRPS